QMVASQARTGPKNMRQVNPSTVGVDGTFDLFVRAVRWWDVRHWIFHPDREIRVSLRVAGFIAALEFLPGINNALKLLMRVPS
ncbi:MAG: hypothetical protein Q8L84_06235, partial [Hyphomonas sp.]|nr:hypothetical protein [Hyphomonas sp.]